MSAPLNRARLRDRLAERMDEHTSGRVVRVHPLGFPILEATASLLVRVSEPLGLVERRLLLAVQQFGPTSSKRLDEILGIGAEIIGEMLMRISAYEPQLQRHGDSWALPAGVDLAQIQQFSKEVVEQRRFVVNGLTGQLLPANFWKRRHREQLDLDPQDADAPLVDIEGLPTDIRWKLANSAQDARQGITGQLAASAEEKLRLGIPALTQQVCENTPSQSRVRWLAAFLFVYADGSISLVDTRHSDLPLAGKEFAEPTYWKLALAGTPNFDSWQLSSEVRGERLHDKLADTLPGGSELRWDPARAAWRLSLPPESGLGEQSPATPEEEGAVSRWLGHLRMGWMWTHTHELLLILPGDAATACLRAILRGVHELRGILRNLPAGHPELASFDLKHWWQQWTTGGETEEAWKEEVAGLPLDQFLRRARRVRDAEFREKLDELAEL